MPLIKSASAKAFEQNVRQEIHAGRQPDQAVAIAYSIQRKAQGKKDAKKKVAKKKQ